MNHLAPNLEPITPVLSATMQKCRDDFAETLAFLLSQVMTIPAPGKPNIYDPVSEQAHVLRAEIRCIRAMTDAFQELCERCANDCEAYAGARLESYQIVVGGVEDFLSPLERAVDEMEDKR